MLDEYPKKHHSKLKKRSRKGIPDCFRGVAWCKIMGMSCDQKSRQDIALQMNDFFQMPLDEKVRHDIEKDVQRTMCTHVYFSGENSEGHLDLTEVLTCIH